MTNEEFLKNCQVYLPALSLEHAKKLVTFFNEMSRQSFLSCSKLHHNKKDQHTFEQDCPVIKRLAKLMNKITGASGEDK